jgi:hypothetical protein
VRATPCCRFRVVADHQIPSPLVDASLPSPLTIYAATPEIWIVGLPLHSFPMANVPQDPLQSLARTFRGGAQTLSNLVVPNGERTQPCGVSDGCA